MIKLVTNFKDLKIGLIIAQKKIEAASKEGMRRAVLEFMDDTLHKPPMVPRRSGSLAASESVFVDGKLVSTSAGESHSGGTGSTPLMVFPKVSEELEGALIVNKPYAASVHEGVSRWGTSYKFRWPGSGKKWVQAKLTRYGEKYFNLIARKIKAL